MDATRAGAGKWVLTQEGLDRFFSRLDPDRHKAGQEYEQVRRKLITFFHCHGWWDAEALVDETIDRVIRRLDEIEIRDLMAFVRGVARHVALERRKLHREVPLDSIAEPSRPETDPEDEILATARLTCLEQCGQRLSEGDRDLLVEYYRHEKAQKIENKRRMAQSMGISAGALRIRAFRARQQLEACVTACVATETGT
jgi:RNA polymerase sigma factor (sigma-70 family)